MSRNYTHHIHRVYSSHGRTMTSFRYSYVPISLDEPQLSMTNFSDFDGLCKKYGETNHWKGSAQIKNIKEELKANQSKHREEKTK